jgi:glyoxylase I family protein
MATALNHVAIRVTDLDRATRFYTETFGGEVVVDIALDSEYAEYVFRARAGTTAHIRGILLDAGTIELFAFTPSGPVPAMDQTAAGQMHFCLTVDDVHAAVARAEAAGGRSLFPVMPWLEHHFVYVADPDGNVIELIDVEAWYAVAGRPTLPR